jgi:predicted secreted protein
MKLLHKVLFVISLVVFFENSYGQKITHHRALPIVKLKESSSGKTLVVSKKQIITVTLFNKVDGGYRFDKPLYDSLALRLEKHTERPPAANSAVGSPGRDFWQFVALKKGKTTLKITATRPWSGGGTITIFSIILMVK